MKNILWALFLFPSIVTAQVLRDWNCIDIATHYGYVAVDRDNGVPLAQRVQTTLHAVVTAANSEYEAIDVRIADIRELVSIAHYVYSVDILPRQVKREAYQRCAGGARAAPNIQNHKGAPWPEV